MVLAGTAGTSETAALDLGLADLRGAGADVSFVPADLSDPDEAETAIGSAEQRIGPVTAIVHVASTGPQRECASLSGDDLGAQIARQADGLSNVLGAVSAAGLRALVTLGSIPARYGAAGNCASALAASALAEQARRLRPTLPGCRILHADWPGPGGSGQARVAEPRPPPAAGRRRRHRVRAEPCCCWTCWPTAARRAGWRYTAVWARERWLLERWPPEHPRPASTGGRPGAARGDPRPAPGVGPGVLPRRGTGRRHEDLPPDRPLPGRSPHRRPHGAAAGHRDRGDGRGSLGAGRAAAAAAGQDPDGRPRGAAPRRSGNHAADLRAPPCGCRRDRGALLRQRFPDRSFPGAVPARGRTAGSRPAR